MYLHLMKIRFILFLLSIAVLKVNAQTKINTDSLEKEITLHFKIHPPEAERYSNLTKFGDANVSFGKEQITKELQLAEAVKKSGLIDQPTMDVLDLCHNISIHSPEKGKELLTLLNQPLKDPQLIVPFFMQIVFTGEFGEQLMLKNLNSANVEWQKECAGYLASFATYESSVPLIEKKIKTTDDLEIQQDLIGALTFISSKKSIPIIKKMIESTKDDETQSKAIFAYTELVGFDGLSYLEKIKTIGEQSAHEQKVSIDWIKKETNTQNKYAMHVESDVNFITRFADVGSPVMIWLKKEGLLDTSKALHPVPFTVDQKKEVLKLLIESKGVGLEAAKGQLFLSLQPSDIPALMELRKSCVYSPNTFSFGRLSTVGAFIRYLRKTKK